MRKEVIGDCVLYNGDCLEVLPELSGLHACVTDPPYHLTSVTRRLGNKDSTDARERTQTQGAYNGSCDEIAGRSSAGKEYPDNRGRWPANVLHDASIEIVEALPFEFRHAVRFFYAAKASKEEREDGLKGAGRQWVDGSTVDTPYNRGATKRANHHPTVKPIALMAWLCRLITPPAGRVLDPFMGSGSTGIAAVLQGFAFVGIEREPDYFDIACRRIESALRKPDLFAEDATAQRREASNDIVQELPL